MSPSAKEKKPAAIDQKAVVLALMIPVEPEPVPRTVVSSSGSPVMKNFVTWQCPKPNCMKQCTFEHGKGFTNPFGHLKSCYGLDRLMELYNEAVRAQKASGGTISSHFQVSSATEKERMVYALLVLIIENNLPISIVENANMRAFSKFDEVVGQKSLKDTAFKVVELVERSVGDELKRAKGGQVSHDGWTRGGMHYMCALASYIATETRLVNGTAKDFEKVASAMLAVAPMTCVVHDSDDSDEDAIQEATTFNAENQAKFIIDGLGWYDQTVDDWLKCDDSDNTLTNRKTARILGKPHVPCYSHALDLEVNHMIKNDNALKDVIDKTHKTMVDVKGSLKNSACLRKLTDLSPVVSNATRWSGDVLELNRMQRMRDELIAVTAHEDSTLTMDCSGNYAAKVNKYAKMLGEIKGISDFTQTRSLPYNEIRDALDALMDAVATDKNDPTKALYQCKLGEKYIGLGADIVTDPLFLSGVKKIQDKRLELLTDEEKAAVEHLKLGGEQDAEQDGGNDNSLTLVQKIKAGKRKQREQASENPYMNVNFILGSCAEVERVWSHAGNILTKNRRNMTPQLFEAILYLKYNRRFWNQSTVCEAMSMARTERSQARLAAHEEQEALLEE